MPLHLLGKKSWNVYNQVNIDRVRRDEAEAAAQEDAEEQRQQENDAARRLAILRGEEPPPLLTAAETPGDGSSKRRHEHRGLREGNESTRHESRRKRKRHGEDDTDFEMRLAQDRVGTNQDAKNEVGEEHRSKHRQREDRKRSDAPLVDHAGHIDLFPEERERAAKNSERQIRDDKRKNPDTEREKAKKRQELEDQYTMRFSNAAGRDSAGQLTTGKGPWYAGHGSFSEEVTGPEAPRRDAFGREDPGRKGRDEMRIDTNDPLAMMRRGAAKVREVEKERQKLNAERERELRMLEKEERREKRRRRYRSSSPGSTNHFSDHKSGDSRRRHRSPRDSHRDKSSRSHDDHHRHRH